MHAGVNYDPFRIQKATMSLWAWNFSVGLKNGLFQQNRPSAILEFSTVIDRNQD